jgi:hypothetical protein
MNTLARERCKAELLRRLKTLSPESPRRWGRMTAHQMVCHLADSCRMAIGERQVSVASRPIDRTVIKWIALYLPAPWPAGVPTRPEVNAEMSGTRPNDFAADVAELAALVEALAARRGRNDWPAHPIFGRMSERAWHRWGYLHMDHHLRQFGA